MKFRSILVMLCLVFAASISLSFLSNGNLSTKEFIKKIMVYQSINRQEKLYLHTDKPTYFTGETLWFSAFLTNASNNVLNTTERVLYVELIKPSGTISTKQVFKLEAGRSEGHIFLKNNLKSGKYLLIGYTNWMRNAGADFYFKKEIVIVDDRDLELNNNQSDAGVTANNGSSINGNSTPDSTVLSLKFYPEGGELVDGILTKVAFEAFDQYGQKLNVMGDVEDENGNLIASITTLWNGKGFFMLQPQAGVKYRAVINGTDTFYLPKVASSGYSLKVASSYKSDQVVVTVQQVNGVEGKDFFLLAMQEQKPAYALADTLFTNAKQFVIPKNNFKSGIVQFTLFDNNKTPRCERLLFINNNDQLDIQVKAIDLKHEERSKVTLELEAKDKFGKPVEGSFSMAVTDAKRIGDDNYAPLDFVNYMLVKSNIPGSSALASDLFDNSRKGELKTDLVMLTNGWRRYLWKEVLNDTLQIPDYLEEPGIYIKGQLLRKNSLKPVPSGIDVTMLIKKGFTVYTQPTDERGEFTFLLKDFTDTISAVIQTKNKMDNQKDYVIDLESNLKSKPEDANARRLLSSSDDGNSIDYEGGDFNSNLNLKRDQLASELVRALDQNFFVDTADVSIDEVTVMAEGAKNVKQVMVTAYGSPSKSLGKKQIEDLAEERSWNYGLISVITDAIPGLEIDIRSDDVAQSIDFRPTDRRIHRFYIYVDGEMVGATDDKGSLKYMLKLYDIDQLISLDAEIVASIDLIYPPKGKTSFDLNMEALKDMSFEELSSFSDNFTLAEPPIDINLPEVEEDEVEATDPLEVFENPVFNTSPEAILSIYTKNGQGLRSRTHFKGMLNIKLTGFSKEKEFYSPNYEDETISVTHDERTTIHWSPTIKTDATGKATVEFFNSDVGHLFRADVVGLSNSGLPGNTRVILGQDMPLAVSAVANEENAEMKYSTVSIDNGPEWSDATKMKFTVLQSNNQPANYADISVLSKSWSTIADAYGVFYIDYTEVAESDTIVISFRGEEALTVSKMEMVVNSERLLLKPTISQPIELNGEKLFNGAYKNIYNTKSNKTIFAKSTYREQIFWGNEIHRIIDLKSFVRIPNYGNTSLSFAPVPISGRVFKTEGYDNKAEFSPINNSPERVHILDAFYTEVTFLSRSYKKYYEYKFLGTCQFQNRTMYKVAFDQVDDCSWALHSGFALIDVETNGIAYLNWKASDKGMKYVVPDMYLMGGTTYEDFKLFSEENQAFYNFRNGSWEFKGGMQRISFNLNKKTNSYLREFIITENLDQGPKPYRPVSILDMETRSLLVKEPKYLVQFWREPWFLPANESILKNIPFMHEIIVLSEEKKK